tara:strand:+ start:213 stop:1106 length:894 start_codon:yes stop_codon:yes gene_type:complete
MRTCVFVIITFLIFSCGNNNNILPSSTGNKSDILVVASELFWNNNKAKIKRIFEQPIRGLSTLEPSFKIIHVDHSAFKNILKRSRNILIFEENIKSSIHKNKWAKNQLVVFLQANTNQTLDTERLNKTLKFFESNEIDLIKNEVKKKSNKSIAQDLHSNFSVKTFLPNIYTIVENQETFFWATYNPPKVEEIQHIMFFTVDSKSPNNTKCLNYTDSVISNNLFGTKENTYVTIEELYEPICENNICRGLWKLENGFMGGPFIMKKYYLENKTVISLGLIFAPQKNKRNYVKTLEAIL